MSDKIERQNESDVLKTGVNKKLQTDTHPICQNATDPERCEMFVDRLEQASSNIDPHKT